MIQPTYTDARQQHLTKRFLQLCDLLLNKEIPPPQESASKDVSMEHSLDRIANALERIAKALEAKK